MSIDIEPAVDAVARASYLRDREAVALGWDVQPWEEVAAAYRDRVRPDVTVAATPLEIQIRKQCADDLRKLRDEVDATDDTLDRAIRVVLDDRYTGVGT